MGQVESEADEGAQTSAAWCLSAVLLFMSMLLLRQAFEPPLDQQAAVAHAPASADAVVALSMGGGSSTQPTGVAMAPAQVLFHLLTLKCPLPSQCTSHCK